MPEQELFTLHYIIYRYGFTLVFCNLHCIYFRLVVYIATCTVYIYVQNFGGLSCELPATTFTYNQHYHMHLPTTT